VRSVRDFPRDILFFWKARRESGDPDWFRDRSHAVETCPHATPETIAAQVIAVREKFPFFGPKKIRGRLINKNPDLAWPAASTIGDILKRTGLVKPRRRTRGAAAQDDLNPRPDRPNAEWVMDFKGNFRTGDGERCDPFTLTDAASRYLIEVRITDMTTRPVCTALTRVFEENGVPNATRSDNGPPFGSRGAGGLPCVSVFLLKHGVAPRFTPPASPQDNGDHERMHLTLQQETSATPADDIAGQQPRFDEFRRHFNEERPHEALGQRPPASIWAPSLRALPVRPLEPWYDARHEVRGVRDDGSIKWRGDHVFFGEALAGETIGLCPLPNDAFAARFFDHDLGVLDGHARFLRFAPPRARRRKAPEPAMTP
jgi:transposase InsO family protein